MPTHTWSRIVPALLLGLVLQGCTTSSKNTASDYPSSAGFSSDLDAYKPPGGIVPLKPFHPVAFNGATTPKGKLPSEGVVYGADFPSDTSSDFDNLEIVNPSLKTRLTVLRVGADRTDTNLLSVFAGVKNRSAHRLQIEMQTIYKDNAGNSISEGKGSWVPIVLKPHEETQYRSVAISSDATDYMVRIRTAPDANTP